MLKSSRLWSIVGVRINLQDIVSTLVVVQKRNGAWKQARGPGENVERDGGRPHFAKKCAPGNAPLSHSLRAFRPGLKVGPGVEASPTRTFPSSTLFPGALPPEISVAITDRYLRDGGLHWQCWPSVSSTLRPLGAPISAFARVPKKAWPVRYWHGRIRLSDAVEPYVGQQSRVSAPLQLLAG